MLNTFQAVLRTFEQGETGQQDPGDGVRSALLGGKDWGHTEQILG
jgi:hypothetical protein